MILFLAPKGGALNQVTFQIRRIIAMWLSHHHRRLFAWMAVDALIVFAAYTAAFSVRAFTTPLDYFQSVWALAAVALVMVTMLLVFGVYRRLWSHTSGHGITVIVYAVFTATVLICLIVLLWTPRPIPLSIVVFGNLLACAGFVAIRYRSRLIGGISWRWRAIWHHEFPDQPRRVLIIGAGEAGQTLAWRLKHRFSGHNHKIVGFIDDDPDKHNMYVEGCRVLGNRNDLIAIAQQQDVDLIVVAVHNISGVDFREILTLCENTGAMIKVVPDVFALVKNTQAATLLRDVQAEDLIGRTPITRQAGIDLSTVKNRVIMITGAAGSIGSELSRQVLSYNPQKVILLDNNESGLHDLWVELTARCPETDLVPILADITLYDSIKAIYRRHHPQIVFHAAAYKHVPMLEDYPAEGVRTNILGTRHVAELARGFDVERFVLISTDKAVNPSSVMGASKRICELLLYALDCEGKGTTIYTSVRFGNVLGSRGSVVPTFNRQIESGGPVTVTDPEMTRYFMSIPEAANLIIHAAAMTEGDDVFILKMGEVVRIVELAERMIRLRGLRPYKDIDIQFTGTRRGEKMHEELFNGFEAAVETKHPHIMKHHTWPVNFDCSTFNAKLDRLLQTDFAGVENPLEEFLRVINMTNETLSIASESSN
jgi:FlaA1/EpsC-like NDP-sugar epimerase